MRRVVTTCDLCGCGADKRFRSKAEELKLTPGPYGSWRWQWQRFDLCDACINQIVDGSRARHNQTRLEQHDAEIGLYDDE
jgi:hypothetical protein